MHGYIFCSKSNNLFNHGGAFTHIAHIQKRVESTPTKNKKNYQTNVKAHAKVKRKLKTATTTMVWHSFLLNHIVCFVCLNFHLSVRNVDVDNENDDNPFMLIFQYFHCFHFEHPYSVNSIFRFAWWRCCRFFTRYLLNRVVYILFFFLVKCAFLLCHCRVQRNWMLYTHLRAYGSCLRIDFSRNSHIDWDVNGKCIHQSFHRYFQFLRLWHFFVLLLELPFDGIQTIRH